MHAGMVPRFHRKVSALRPCRLSVRITRRRPIMHRVSGTRGIVAARPSRANCRSIRTWSTPLTAGDEQRLDVFASGNLGMRRLKPVALLPPQDERACNHEGVSQSCTLAQRHIEKSVAKIGPLGAVLAAERGMVSVRRGYHKRIGSGEARYENAGIAGGDYHDLISHTRVVEHLHEFRRRQRRASAPGRDIEAIARAVGGEDEK